MRGHSSSENFQNVVSFDVFYSIVGHIIQVFMIHSAYYYFDKVKLRMQSCALPISLKTIKNWILALSEGSPSKYMWNRIFMNSEKKSEFEKKLAIAKPNVQVVIDSWNWTILDIGPIL